MGSSSPDTSGQNEAARKMAEIAGEQWDRYKQVYAPIEDKYVTDAQNYDTPEQREKAAAAANADVTQGYDDQRSQQERQLASYGISPDSGKFAVVNDRLRGQEAAQEAAAQNNARQQVQNTGWARRTDALSLGKGLPASATAGLNASANAYNGAAKTQQAADNAQSNNISGAVQGAASGFKYANDQGWFDSAGSGFKDGGIIHMRNGGHVDFAKMGIRLRRAYGGPADALAMVQQASAAAPPPGQSGPSPLQQGIGYAQDANKAYKFAKGFSTPSSPYPGGSGAMDLGGSSATPGAAPGTATDLIGSGAPGAEAGAADAAGAAAGDAGGVLGTGIGTGAADMAAGAGIGDAAAAASAATAEAAAATTAATGAAAAGGAETIAALAPLLLLAQGGDVDARKGGGIRGPGTETSDSIPAQLSDGEYVLNAEAVKHFGIDRLNKMNEQGLKNRYGIH